MKNIAIITLSHSTNYGGVLQSVALDRVFKKRGAKVTFIVHQSPCKAYNSVKAYLARRKTVCSSSGIKNKVRIAGGIVRTIIGNRNYFNNKAKIRCFNDFRREMQCTPYYSSCEAIRDAQLNFDSYVTGSDQVWNSTFSRGKLDPCYFLEFSDERSARYSYAASTGGVKSHEEIKAICDKLRGFNGVSVREESLRRQLCESGTTAITVADPTLLLSEDDWKSMEKKVNLPQHYILIYCLESDAELDECIRRVKERTGYPIIDVLPNISKIKSKNKKQSKRFGPAEFLYAVDHADYILTNSFHALAFSYIFKKKFGCVLRKGQEERMSDFLHMLSLSDRIICADTFEKALEDIDYSTINIDELLKISYEYIDSIIYGKR